MTFKEKAIEMLTERGLSDEEAKEVFEAVKANRASKPMSGLWDRSSDGYPPAMLALLKISVKNEWLAWIERTCPEAWFKPLFE